MREALRRERDVCVIAIRRELLQQSANVRPDPEVGDLPRVDADPHRLASAKSCVIKAALRSHVYVRARSAPRARRSERNELSDSMRASESRSATRSPGSTSSAAPSAYSGIAPVRV